MARWTCLITGASSAWLPQLHSRLDGEGHVQARPSKSVLGVCGGPAKYTRPRNPGDVPVRRKASAPRALGIRISGRVMDETAPGTRAASSLGVSPPRGKGSSGEQAALRRVATLVAKAAARGETSPVAEELRDCRRAGGAAAGRDAGRRWRPASGDFAVTGKARRCNSTPRDLSTTRPCASAKNPKIQNISQVRGNRGCLRIPG